MMVVVQVIWLVDFSALVAVALLRPSNGPRYLTVCMPEEQRRWEVGRMTDWERSLGVFGHPLALEAESHAQ